MPLSCENTNTLMPYIDLVNEVLEQAVTDHLLQHSTNLLQLTRKEALEFSLLSQTQQNVQLPRWLIIKLIEKNKKIGLEGLRDVQILTKIPGQHWQISGNIIVDIGDDVPLDPPIEIMSPPEVDTQGTTEELRTFPEHQSIPPYLYFINASDPWSFPFDVWAEEAQLYFDHLGFERFQWLEAKRKVSVEADASEYRKTSLEVACNYLQLPYAARVRIVDPQKKHGPDHLPFSLG